MVNWQQRIGFPDDWLALKARLIARDLFSDLVVNIANRCDGETQVFWCTGPDALAIWTPRRRLLLGSMGEDQSRALVAHLEGHTLEGVAAYHPEVDAFRDAWLQGGTKRQAKPGMTLISHDLPTLLAPRPCPGRARRGSRADLDLALRWQTAFRDEVDEGAPLPRREVVDASLARQELWFWEVDGVPVCYAGLRWPAPESSRIGPVYTPLEQRGKGYASALVYHVAQLGSSAQRCTLFTDAANPTSNKIYQALGFRPGPTFQEWDFYES
jgi:GNAT superfamily N-acetyltransferase